MFIPNEQLKNILLSAKLLTEEVWRDVEKNATRLCVGVEDILKERDIVPGHVLYEAVSRAIGIPYVNLKVRDVDEQVVSLFKKDIVVAARALPFHLDKKKRTLHVAFLNPCDKRSIKAIGEKTPYTIAISFTGLSSFKFGIRYYQYESREVITHSLARAGMQYEKNGTHVFSQLLEHMYFTQPSDVHIEHTDHGGMMKFRVDGYLRDEFQLSRALTNSLCAHIRRESKIRLDRHHLTADGRFSTLVFGERVSFRVSILPTHYGENIVLRVLDESRQKMSFHHLGLRDAHIATIKEHVKKPSGLTLVAGPTGTGKTSTLYTLLKFLNVEGVSIATIEDPVEYTITHINQTQVDLERGLTFASGLREILRQDPNIIMASEIRDTETASTVMQAALTGHSVISTLHATSALGALTRLRNLDVRSYALAQSTNLIISQRLVRHICPYCSEAYTPSRALLGSLDTSLHFFSSVKRLKRRGLIRYGWNAIQLFRGRGCTHCKGTGFGTRIGLFELLPIDEELRSMILNEEPTPAIERYLGKHGHLSLFEDGLIKVFEGKTTIEEVARVVS